MRVMSVDPSLTSLGYAYHIDGEEGVCTVRPKRLQGLQRLTYIRDEVLLQLSTVQPSLLVFEGYAMGRAAFRAFDLGELGGILKVAIYEKGVPLLLVPPTNLKLFATGSGRADKDAVRIAMNRVGGILFANDDEADAYGLLQMGLAFLSSRHRPRLKGHYKNVALSGCSLVSCGS